VASAAAAALGRRLHEVVDDSPRCHRDGFARVDAGPWLERYAAPARRDRVKQLQVNISTIAVDLTAVPIRNPL